MSEQMQYTPVDRRPGLTQEEFIESYQRKNRPVVIEGMAENWKHRWTPEILKARFGEHPITAETAHLFVNDRKKKTMTLAEVIDQSLAASLEYRVRSFSFLSQVKELREEYEANNAYENYLEKSGKPRAVFWISPPGNSTVLHNDSFYENLNVQVYGRKRFLMMHPSMYKNVHAHFLSESPVTPLEPDLERFPKFANVEILEAVTNPGDIVFLPQFWWHYVTALEFTVNVNTFMKTSRRSMYRVTRDLPFMPKWTYRAVYNERFGKFVDRSEKRLYDLYAAVFGKKKKEVAAAH